MLLGHNGTDSKRKSPLAHLASLGSVHPCALGSSTAVFQGKVMRALVVVGGTGRGCWARGPCLCQCAPFLHLSVRASGTGVCGPSAKAREMGMVAGLHFELPWQPRASTFPVFWKLSKSSFTASLPFLPFHVHPGPELSH